MRGRGFQRRTLRLPAAALQHQQARSTEAFRHAEMHRDVGRMEHAIDAGRCVRRVDQPGRGIDRGPQSEQPAQAKQGGGRRGERGDGQVGEAGGGHLALRRSQAAGRCQAQSRKPLFGGDASAEFVAAVHEDTNARARQRKRREQVPRRPACPSRAIGRPVEIDPAIPRRRSPHAGRRAFTRHGRP